MTPSMLHLLMGWSLVSLLAALLWIGALIRRDRRRAARYAAALDRGDWAAVDRMTTATGAEPLEPNG